jgi:hypothetical protein
MTRYREYQARLAARAVGETFDRAAAFLLRASADGAPADGGSDTLGRDRPGHVTASGMA